MIRMVNYLLKSSNQMTFTHQSCGFMNFVEGSQLFPGLRLPGASIWNAFIVHSVAGANTDIAVLEVMEIELKEFP